MFLENQTPKPSCPTENVSCNVKKGLLEGKEHLKKNNVIFPEVCCSTSNHNKKKSK